MLCMHRFDTSHLTAAQLRARAEFISEISEARSAGEVLEQLLDLAEQYERLAQLLGTRRINDAA